MSNNLHLEFFFVSFFSAPLLPVGLFIRATLLVISIADKMTTRLSKNGHQCRCRVERTHMNHTWMVLYWSSDDLVAHHYIGSWHPVFFSAEVVQEYMLSAHDDVFDCWTKRWIYFCCCLDYLLIVNNVAINYSFFFISSSSPLVGLVLVTGCCWWPELYFYRLRGACLS